jgi:gamma-glutamyltranspeptidase/glutathione hydrolase
MAKKFCLLALSSLFLATAAFARVPVEVSPVTASRGMVVAGHPDAARAGVEILHGGGNAIDAAIAVSLALGVAEPYGSGLGGKLMVLYYEAASRKTYALDAMDAAGSINVARFVKTTGEQRSYGYTSVAVPGLPDGLWTAHQRWGKLAWAATVQPAITLAREGFEILPKTRNFFAEQEKKLRRGDAEIARLYLPHGELPEVGSRLANEDLARTLQLFAQHGRDGFYRGPVAEKIVRSVREGGGSITLNDLAAYQTRIVEPIEITFRGNRIVSSPPPTNGAPLFLTVMKALESEEFSGELQSANNLDRIGRVWRIVQPLVQRDIGDVPQAWFNFEKLVAPDSIAAIRKEAFDSDLPVEKVAWFDDSGLSPSYAAATTHFAVVDADGNIVCATQSQSFHFGAGVVPPGTGVVLNNSMSNFAVTDPKGVNYAAAGKRPRSTISPTIVLREGKPVFAIGIPGASRIPTALLQVLLDRLAFNRPLADAIGNTRIHFDRNWRENNEESFEAESSFPEREVAALRKLGWKVELREAPNTGRYFGGINAIELNADGSYTGYADPRRTNAAVGY